MAARILALCLALMVAAPAAGAAEPRPVTTAKIVAVIDRWYEELKKKDEGRLWGIVTPGFIDASPPYRYIDTGSAALGPRVYDSLPATALHFAYDIDFLRIDENFARVAVWERGYFYAFANENTYELAAATTFVLERQPEDGRWLILAHQSGGYGIPPDKVTNPMPDMRELYLERKAKEEGESP